MAVLHDTFQIAGNARDQFVPGKQVFRVYRLASCPEKIGLDPVFFEFTPIDKSAIFQFLYDP